MSRHAVFDPLAARHTPVAHEHTTQSYWRDFPHAEPFQSIANSLPNRCNTLIIGAGYTGLNAAIELAAQQDGVVVIDAGAIGAGCSGRNAGFVLPASGRLSVADYARQFGNDTADNVVAEFNHGVTHLAGLVQTHAIDCQWHSARYLRLAHRPSYVTGLARLADVNAPWPRTFVSGAALQQQLPGIRHAFAGLQQTPAARVHPLALVRGLAAVAERMGAKVVSDCPALAIDSNGKAGCHITTTQGTIQADHVMLCTNAYATRALFPAVTTRQLPVLSSVAVTEPLSDWQLQHIGLDCDTLVMDTRRLKYYYRLLPDNRLLFGGRGAVSGANALNPVHRARLHHAMQATLPSLRDLNFSHYWCGWVSVSYDDYPRVFSVNQRISASLGYCGAGISFASLAGKRLAQRRIGETLPELPFYSSAPQRFPRPIISRLGQRAYYHYAKLRDQF